MARSGVQFTDNSVNVISALDAASLAYLNEASGEIVSQAKQNSRPIKYGKYDVKNSWKYVVDKDKMTSTIGSTLEPALWEELGTGEYALNKDGRKGWWVYVEGNDIPSRDQHQYTEEEARRTVAYLRIKGLKAHMTKGSRPQRPLFRAFTSLKAALIRRAEEVLKARMGE